MDRHIMKASVTAIFVATMSATSFAQKIDFNNSTNANHVESGFAAWQVAAEQTDTQTFDEVTITISAGDATYTDDNDNVITQTLNSNWWKDGVNKYSKLAGDIVGVYGKKGTDKKLQLTKESLSMKFEITGLSAGHHSLLFYLNCTDGIDDSAPVDMLLNNTLIQKGIIQPNRAETPQTCAKAFTEFDVNDEEEAITIMFTSTPEDGKTYKTTGIFICGMRFDANLNAASEPSVKNEDMHVETDDGGTLTLSWTPSPTATKSNIYMGTSQDDMTLVAEGVTTSSFQTAKLSSLSTYFWRVDEVDASNNVSTGDVWSFRPAHLAFPGAEGYGRYAIGGRGGSVYHVTSLDDDADDPQPGTFRYGITKETGPRTIVFDISGVIKLKSRLTCSDRYVTIAGQTAPGKGILLTGAPFGMASDGITRFIRQRLGYPDEGTASASGLDGLGMAGNDHSIMDHCSIGWTIDEAFSSRGAKNITLQHTLISEALNVADHPNYASGTKHGYAATIGGDCGSYHHNLLVHNDGRNWSMAGGLDGSGAYAGRHDMFNNVCYNWYDRTTDGGTHEGNFVANYYKVGPATLPNKVFLLSADLEGKGSGTQSYFVSNNVRENADGSLTTANTEGDMYRKTVKGEQVVDWTVFQDAPFFESYATIETAQAAYKNVLSLAGCNQPQLDAHDSRMVAETIAGSYSKTGSRSGLKGLIDSNADQKDYEDEMEWYNDAETFPVETRPDDFDSDADGMPDWWETIKGSDPLSPDQNTDADDDGYTALEDYLNWMAEPHYFITPGSKLTINLRTLFAGYNNAPVFTTSYSSSHIKAKIEGDVLTLTSEADNGVYTIPVSASDADAYGTLTRNINIAVTEDMEQSTSTAIKTRKTDANATSFRIYDINGRLVRTDNDTSSLPRGLYVVVSSDANGNTTARHFLNK